MTTQNPAAVDSTAIDYEVMVVGAGVTGIHQLYRAREAGFSVRLLEAGEGIGGVWFWNRYPGARLDSESYTYGYLFDKELFLGWKWKERFASQPENEQYFNYAVDKLDLRKYIQCGAKVTSVVFDEDTATYLVSIAGGGQLRARFVVAATGVLSVPVFPDVPGIDDFKGISHHTGLWPDEQVDFVGKRVAVVGTGSSGVQVIPAILDDVASLTVYQRSPNWCTPLGNAPITQDEQQWLEAEFESIRARLDESLVGFLHEPQERRSTDDSEEERRQYYEKMWASPGFSKMVSHYADVLLEPAANEDWCRFMADKIRQIVKDPRTAEALIPTDHGWAGKRPPFVTDYFEAYNDPKVKLVSLKEAPLVRVTESGIETSDGLEEFDIIVWASGFDFGTGALTRLGVRGRDGLALEDYWADGPRTFAGLMAHGFPNFFFPAGPHGAAGNNPRYADDQVLFVHKAIERAINTGRREVEVPAEVEQQWNQAIEDTLVHNPFGEHSYFFGANIDGKARKFLLNPGGRPLLWSALQPVLESKYQGFVR